MTVPEDNSPWITHAVFEAPGVKVRLFTWISAAPTEYTRMADDALYLMLPPYTGATLGSYRLDKQFGGFVNVGNLMFTPADIPVRFRGPGGRVRSVCCEFEEDRFKSVTGLTQGWDDFRLAAALDIRDARVSQILLRTAQEAAAPGFACKSLIEGMSLSMMVDLARYLLGATANTARASGRLAPWQLRRITEFIEDQADRSATVSDLAELCGISASHLKRTFRQTTGQTVHTYIEQVRLDKAKSLLKGTQLPIKEIAGRLGFAASSGFSIAFRRASGQTPTAFRQQFRERRSVPRLPNRG